MTEWLRKQLEFASESRRELPNWMEKSTNIFQSKTESFVIDKGNNNKASDRGSYTREYQSNDNTSQEKR